MGGGDQWDSGSRPAWAKVSKTPFQTRSGMFRVVMVIDARPHFNEQTRCDGRYLPSQLCRRPQVGGSLSEVSLRQKVR
jgi:hypothetical protein